MQEVILPKHKQSFASKLNSVISVFSPSWAFKRALSEKRFSLLNGIDANPRSRRGSRGGYRADTNDVGGDLSKVKSREDAVDWSIQLNESNGFASGLTTTIVSNVIGSGMTPQSRLNQKYLNITKEDAKVFSDACERYFKTWSKQADITGACSFAELQNLTFYQQVEYGESFTLIQNTAKYGVKIRVISPSRVCTPHDKLNDKSVVDGIQIDSDGRAIGIWVKKGSSFTNNSKDFERIDIYKKGSTTRKQVLHIFEKKKAGQYRGMPFFTPVINYFLDLDEYFKAELLKGRLGASIFNVVETENADELADASIGDFGNPSSTTTSNERIQEATPGKTMYLNKGEKMTLFNANVGTGSFDPFVNKILMVISSSLGLPVDLVTKVFTSSYSAARAALAEAKNLFRKYQKMVAENFCQPIWEAVIEDAYLRSALPEVGFYDDFEAWTNAKWNPNGWAWISPLEEARAAELAYQNGHITLQKIFGDRGEDWETESEQIAVEQEFLISKGLPTIKDHLFKGQIVKGANSEHESTTNAEG